MTKSHLGKEGKKKSRKQKLKDLNEKGEKKAGSEMDAFNMEVSFLTFVLVQLNLISELQSYTLS